jgi:hypothetical protein
LCRYCRLSPYALLMSGKVEVHDSTRYPYTAPAFRRLTCPTFAIKQLHTSHHASAMRAGSQGALLQPGEIFARIPGTFCRFSCRAYLMLEMIPVTLEAATRSLGGQRFCCSQSRTDGRVRWHAIPVQWALS